MAGALAPLPTPPAPPFVPDFDAVVAGQRLPAELRARVTALRFDEALEGAGRVELDLADPGLALLDELPFALEAPFALSLGYRRDGPVPVFAGEITGVEANFPATGMPGLIVTAQDASRRLNEGRRQRGYPWQLPDAVIATIVAAENGLLAMPDAAAALLSGLRMLSQRPRFQNRQTDAEFLRAIATEYGFEMWVEGDVLNFRPLFPGVPAPEVELRWGSSLLEFAPRITTIGQVLSVRIGVWIQAMRTQLAVEVTWNGARVSVRVRADFCGAGDSSTVTAGLEIAEVPLESPVEGIRLAIGELRRRLNSRMTARGSAVGDPRLRAGRVISVTGVGPDFGASTWRLTSVAHTLGESGYRTAFQARREIV
jgi:phage protein D